MDEQDLAAIEARANAARDAPWGVYRSLNGWHYTVGPDSPVTTVFEQQRADVEFIAHARTDVLALVAEVRRLREALTQISDAHPALVGPGGEYNCSACEALSDLAEDALRGACGEP